MNRAVSPSAVRDDGFHIHSIARVPPGEMFMECYHFLLNNGHMGSHLAAKYRKKFGNVSCQAQISSLLNTHTFRLSNHTTSYVEPISDSCLPYGKSNNQIRMVFRAPTLVNLKELQSYPIISRNLPFDDYPRGTRQRVIRERCWRIKSIMTRHT